MVYPIGKRVLVPIFNLWVKEVNGLKNLPDGPCIIAANHASYMDHLIIVCTIIKHKDRKVHFLSKKEHFDSSLKAAWHRYAGAIPLDRERGGKRALKLAIKALKQGKIIAIHPEGARTLDGKLQRGKTGVARLAIASKAPVIPIGLIGTFEILPKGKYIPRLKRATINIGNTMYFREYYGKRFNRKILRNVTDRIMKKIAKLSGQSYDFRK